jgi:hypothetical protein
VFIEPYIGIQARHADVDTGIAILFAIRIASLDFGLVKHVWREFDDADVVMVRAGHGFSSSLFIRWGEDRGANGIAHTVVFG